MVYFDSINYLLYSTIIILVFYSSICYFDRPHKYFFKYKIFYFYRVLGLSLILVFIHIYQNKSGGLFIYLVFFGIIFFLLSYINYFKPILHPLSYPLYAYDSLWFIFIIFKNLILWHFGYFIKFSCNIAMVPISFKVLVTLLVFVILIFIFSIRFFSMLEVVKWIKLFVLYFSVVRLVLINLPLIISVSLFSIVHICIFSFISYCCVVLYFIFQPYP